MYKNNYIIIRIRIFKSTHILTLIQIYLYEYLFIKDYI